MSHSGSDSSLSTPGSQILPCTMGSEPDLTLYFYGSAKHKPPPTASYISQRWGYDCDLAWLRRSSIFRKALSTSQAKFTMHMHGLEQSKRCKTKPSSHGGTLSAVTRLQDWAGWVWHEPQAPGCPSWVLSHFSAVLPHSLPVPHALQKKCFPKIFQRHRASFYWNYYRDQSCHESTSADHWDSNAVSTRGFLS